MIIAPFKAHCDLGFFNGVLLNDAKGLLVKPGTNTQASRQLRFKSINEIEKKRPTQKSIRRFNAWQTKGLLNLLFWRQAIRN